MADLQVTADQIAQRWGITADRVRQLAKDGIIPKDKRGQYPYIACCEARIKYLQTKVKHKESDEKEPTPLEQAELRIKLAKAEEQERKNLRESGELVSIHDIKPAILEAFTAFKTHLLHLAASLPIRLVGLQDLKAIRKILDEAINDCLTQISNIRVLTPDETPGDGAAGDDGSSTETDDESVGGTEPDSNDQDEC